VNLSKDFKNKLNILGDITISIVLVLVFLIICNTIGVFLIDNFHFHFLDKLIMVNENQHKSKSLLEFIYGAFFVSLVFLFVYVLVSAIKYVKFNFFIKDKYYEN
jgi:ABC-type phosphate transport system permease subunit